MQDADQVAIALRSMGMLNPPEQKYLERFCARIHITPRGCWEWQRARVYFGYGSMSFRGDHWTTHRLIYTWVYGSIPPGMFICHHCDNPPCCNPDHLFCGTAADNIRDRDAKGRGRSGKAPSILSTPEISDHIVAAHQGGATLTQIARWYGVARERVADELQRRGVYERKSNPHRIFDAEKQKIRELRAAGLSHASIARELGVAETSIWKWIHKLGLP